MISLTRFAEGIAAARRTRIDRMARRLRAAMVCWLCENAPELAFGFAPPTPAERPHLPPRRTTAAILPPVLIQQRPPDPLALPPFDDFFQTSDRELNAEDDRSFFEE
jgi:hypothetical protein